MGSCTKAIPKWDDGPRANTKQNDDEPTMKTTMVCDRGRDWCMMVHDMGSWAHGSWVHRLIGSWAPAQQKSKVG